MAKQLSDEERIARKLARSDRANQEAIKQDLKAQLKRTEISLGKLAAFKDFADKYTTYGTFEKPKLLKQNTFKVNKDGSWDRQVTANTARQYMKKYAEYLKGTKHSRPGKQSGYTAKGVYATKGKYSSGIEEDYDVYMEQQERKRASAARKAFFEQQHEQKRQHAAEQKRLNEVFGGETPAIFAGVSPWDKRYGEFRRLNRLQTAKIGGNPKGIKSPDKKQIQLADGTTATVIDSHLGVPLGFSQMYGYNGPADTATEIINHKQMTSLEYAERAFDGKHKTKQQDGCGHITHLEYSAYFQLLKVTFARGDVVIYYRVPSTVAAELLHFAETKQTSVNTFDGNERHVLGIRFWDLIRIRGTKHGSRYRFEYKEQMEGSGESPTGRPSEYMQSEAPEEVLKKDEASGRKLLEKYGEGTNTIRISRKEMAEDIYEGEYDKEDIDDYFNNGQFDADLGKLRGSQRSKLQAVFNDWDSDVGSTMELARKIILAGGNLQ